MEQDEFIIGPNDRILVTGAAGFIGPALIRSLVRAGFRNLRALIRPSSDTARFDIIANSHRERANIQLIRGNLLSLEDCLSATEEAAVILHLAAGTGSKSFPDAFLNSVVTTRNLLEASLKNGCLRRFVSLSSFAVYANTNGGVLNESSPLQENIALRGEAYAFAKAKQDELVAAYGKRHGVPYVIVRPGSVFGPGKSAITGRVGIDTFGFYIHLGGSNRLPLTYVDNCADAILLAGVKKGVDGEIFNVVDDDLPSSREFLRLYKRKVRNFKSIYCPHSVSYALCWLWERYSAWTAGQLPPVFNRSRWRAEWKRTVYTNEKAKMLLGWHPKVSMREGLNRYLEACREQRCA